MPNWVRNQVSVGNKQALDECIKREKDGDEFDFNVVIPMPEHIFKGNLGFNEREKYGKDNWYDWSIEHWGTKWNGGKCRRTYDDTVEFETAWATPEPVIKAMSEKYKTKVDVYYADEDLGNNCGHYIYDSGKKILDEVGDHLLAEEIWGWLDGEEDENCD